MKKEQEFTKQEKDHMKVKLLKNIFIGLLLIILCVLYTIMFMCLMEESKALTFVRTFLLPFAILYVLQVPHEYLHSYMSKLILKDVGKISFSFRYGYFYTEKPMKVWQYTLIAITPLIVLTSVLYICFKIWGYNIWLINMPLLILLNIGSCFSDIAGTLSYVITRNYGYPIYLEPRK